MASAAARFRRWMRQTDRPTRQPNKSTASENHAHATALHFLTYNFITKHATLKTTPAVAAGIAAEPMTMLQFVEMLERDERLTGGRLTDYLPAASKSA